MNVNYELMGLTKNRRLQYAKIKLRKPGVTNRGKKMKRLEHIAMARVTKALDMTWILFITWLCRVLDYFEFIWNLTQFLFLSSVSVLWFAACTNPNTKVGAIHFCCNSLLVVRFILLSFFLRIFISIFALSCNSKMSWCIRYVTKYESRMLLCFTQSFY